MKSRSLAIDTTSPIASQQRPAAFEGEGLTYLKSYIREPEFKVLLNNIVRSQVALGFKSLSVLSRSAHVDMKSTDKSFFISALALAYTCYLQSRVLIVETREQPKNRELLFNCILGKHPSCMTRDDSPESPVWAGEPGFIDLLSTESFFEGERELADFQLGEHIRRCQEDYDLILVDTAPLDRHDENSIHPLIVSRYMDQSILLVGEGENSEQELEPVVGLLRRNDVSLLGVVEGPSMEKEERKINSLQGVFSGVYRKMQAIRGSHKLKEIR